MELIRVFFNRCSALCRSKKLDEELDEELHSHIDFAIEEKMRLGMSAQEARTEALRAFGGVTQTKETYRELGDSLFPKCSFRMCATPCVSCCAIPASR